MLIPSFKVNNLHRFAAASAMAGLLAAPLPAFAHDVVLDSNPENGAVVKEFPEEVTLEFSGMIKPDFNTFAITDLDSGEQLYTGEPEVDGPNASLAIPADKRGGEGKYQLGYQITSSDGHATRGKIAFEVSDEGSDQGNDQGSDQDGAANAADQSENTQGESQKAQERDDQAANPADTNNLGLIAGIAAAVMLLGILVLAIRRRR
ncbi:copper resistance CopC family protein [Corynebacterium pelargi]|uniref:Uncharacterized protein n=1 Tax=Corynebacterium pelargi TaxID=1471400 RepID=A0A410W8H9_9CORY|nr:copper resistance protein CopC [Corynebacterium pelargi]QAU52251.1 hypothetical protein CPELA_04895 [Corynebacterium pelargi]GGG69079.1 hypothetical protein GCM10007338_02170 [Corynebacterium pelargi]